MGLSGNFVPLWVGGCRSIQAELPGDLPFSHTGPQYWFFQRFHFRMCALFDGLISLNQRSAWLGAFKRTLYLRRITLKHFSASICAIQSSNSGLCDVISII